MNRKEIWRAIRKSFACEIERESDLTTIEKVLSVAMVLSPVVSAVMLDKVVSLFGK